MKYLSHLVVLGLLVAIGVSTAGTDKTVDARSFMTPIIKAAKTDLGQVTAFENAFNLQHDAARSVFAGTEQNVTLTNVEIPLHGTANLVLERTPAVFDATSKIMMAAPGGKTIPIRVRPIESFKGTVNGDPNTWVTLHYSEGDLTGFIQHADGTRTVITRADEMRASKNATPHVLADENGSVGGPALKDFVCGSEDLPENEQDAVTNMLVPTSLKMGETIQQLELTELRLAVVLREDIFTELSRRGYDEERTVQHFAKIVAAMSQAYEQDLRARMFISYLLIFSEDVPSGYFNDGATPGGLLQEFSLDWSGSYGDVERTVAHLYTRKVPVGGSFVGGIAFLNGMCKKTNRGGYAVSTLDLTPPSNIPGTATSRNGYVWDVFVASHEIGHNVGSRHTHNCFWSPPVDTCQIKSDNTDACFDSGKTPRSGTIMSYCHLVNGSSTPLTFGTRVSERMRSWMDQSCMEAPPTKTVSITSPRGPDSWSGGEQMTIKYVSHRVDKVNLEYSLNLGESWNEIESGIPAVDTVYVWTLPNIGTTNLLLRISDASDSDVNYVSLAGYTIKVPIDIILPVEGDRLGIGYNARIQYRKDVSVPKVDIYYTTNGSDWTLIEEERV